MNRPFDFRKIIGGRFVNRPYEIDSSAVGATVGRTCFFSLNQIHPRKFGGGGLNYSIDKISVYRFLVRAGYALGNSADRIAIAVVQPVRKLGLIVNDQHCR